MPATALARCARELGPLAAVHPLEMSFLDGLRNIAGRRAPGERLLVLFTGSSIGNFEPEAAIHFVDSIRRRLAPGDALLLGTDLVKPTAQLLDAYDDPTGVTAAFNLNLLGRINRELDGDFDLRQFAHVIRYHEEAQRIEMHLRSRVYQIVSIRKADLIVDFGGNHLYRSLPQVLPGAGRNHGGRRRVPPATAMGGRGMGFCGKPADLSVGPENAAP